MRVIHVLRKPCSESTVAANTLKHGTGGINIDASRVAHTESVEFLSNRSGRKDGNAWANMGLNGKPHADKANASGRWPANVILQHLDGCRCDGVKKVKKGGGTGHASSNLPHKEGFLTGKVKGGFTTSHYGEDGKETVANWICEPGCPVARLDADSLAGGMHSAGSSRSAKREAGKTGMFPMDGDGHRFGDKGGASRFYKQVGGK